MLWRFPALHYCIGHDSRACGDHWVRGSLKGLCVCHLHMSVVLLCSAYRVFLCSLLFQCSPPLSTPLCYILYSLLYRFSTFLPVQCDRCWGRGWGRVFFFFLLAGRACGWVASRVGSWVFWLLGFGFSSSRPAPLAPCSWVPNLHMRQRR